MYETIDLKQKTNKHLVLFLNMIKQSMGMWYKMCPLVAGVNSDDCSL